MKNRRFSPGQVLRRCSFLSLIGLVAALPFAIANAAQPLPKSVSDATFAVNLRNVRLGLSRNAPTAEAQAKFDALDSKSQAAFLLRRKKFMQLVGSAMAGPRLSGAVVSGATSLGYEKVSPYLPPLSLFSPVFRPLVKLGKKIYYWLMPPAEFVAQPNPEILAEMEKSDQLEFDLGEPEPIPDILPEGTLSARGVEVIRSVLDTLDRQLWNDCRKVAETTHYNVTLLIGPSGGVAGGDVGFFKMGGVEIEAGFDFESGRFYYESHPATQRLTKALMVLESHFIIGVLLKFVKRENGRRAGDGVDSAIQFPPVLSYRSGESMVGFGLYGGFNLLDWGCLYMLAFTDHHASGGILFLIFKALSMLSTYGTEYKAYDNFSTLAQRFADWVRSAVLTPEERSAAQLVLNLSNEADAEIEREHIQLEKLSGWDRCLDALRIRTLAAP
jgi:hypothetical protein